MKRFSSYCTCIMCPITECERHYTKNVKHEEAYDFRGTCPEFRQYIVDEMNKMPRKKSK